MTEAEAMKMKIEAAPEKVILIELVFNNTGCTPPIEHRLALTMGPLGAWTIEGNMPLNKAAKQWIDAVVDEANRQGVRLVRDFSD